MVEIRGLPCGHEERFFTAKKILANAILLLQQAIHKSSKKHQLNWKCCNFTMQGDRQSFLSSVRDY